MSQTAVETSSVAEETRRVFPVDERTGVWVVLTGELKLFAVSDSEHPELKALQPLCSARAGQAVFGLPSDGAGLTFVARPEPGSHIQVRSLSDFLTEESAQRVAWVEGWIATLSSVFDEPPPRTAEPIEAGTRVIVVDEPRPFSPKQALVWVRHLSGRSRLLGRPEMIVNGDSPWPLSSLAWLEAEPGSELSAEDTGSVLAGSEWPQALRAFHLQAMVCVSRRLAAAADGERERFRLRGEADVKAMETALRHLASPLRKKRDRVEAGELESLDTPLMHAITAIGASLGVSMKPHPDMVRGRAVRYPVASVARASRVRYRRVALKDDWLRTSSEPLLVYRDSDRYPLALLPRRSRNGYLVYSAEHPAPVPFDSESAAALNPFGYMFYRPFPEKALSLADLLAFGLKGARRDLLAVVAMSMAAGLLALALPMLTGVVFDSLIPGARRAELITVSGLLVVAAIAAAGFGLSSGFSTLRLQGRMSASIQAAMWDRLLNLPVPFFRDFSSGDLATRSMAIAQIRTVLTSSTLAVLLSGVASLFSFALLFYYSPRLALVATLLTAVGVAVAATVGVVEMRLQRRISAQAGIIAGLVLEFITGIAKFRVAGVERRAFVQWVKAFAAQKQLDFDARRVANVLSTYNSVYLVVCLAVLFYVHSSTETFGDSALSTGQFLAFLAAFTQFMLAALAVSSATIGMMTVVPLYERAAPILKALPEVTAAQSDPGELRGEIAVHHLAFQYNPDAPMAVRDLSFRIHPGEYVAFVGPSGCGKSTVFRLLMGFETPTSGAIYYDGKDLAGLDLQAVRRQIGVVLQTGRLLGGSIKDNICGAADYPPDEVMEAARLAGLEDDIKAMPMGLHTMIIGDGGGLSGGQRQRLLVARAIIGKPRILLFDEATSALDNRTQAIVSHSLSALKATRIVIAHRLTTIVEADRICVMDQGRIVQEGTFAELMQGPGLFRELAERQLT